MIVDNTVVYDKAQTLTEAQKTQARANIGALDESQLPIIVQEAGESESLVMSQKAVTDLVSEALENIGTVEYDTVDSVSEMTDPTKQYVLSSTGTIWSYKEKKELIEYNAYNSETATFNKRISVSGGGETTRNGKVMTDYIAFEYKDDYQVIISGLNKLVVNYSSIFEVVYYSADKNVIDVGLSPTGFGISAGSENADYTDLPVTFNLCAMNEAKQAKYVRIIVSVANSSTLISAANCEGLVINMIPKNSYRTISDWIDTGVTPSEVGNNGGNYVTLLTKINHNTSDISEVSNRVTALETGSGNVTIPAWWENAVNTCIAKIKALQKDAGINAVTFPFFSDNHENVGYAGVLIAKVMKECNIPYCFFGGDNIGSGLIPNEATMIQQEKDFHDMMSYIPEGKFCRALGNHDGFWKVSSTEKHSYTRGQVFDLFMREYGTSQNKHFGVDGTYYYVDDVTSKVRFIVLNSNPSTIGAGNETIDSTQLNWLQNAALSFDEEGWGVVIISHAPIANYYHTNYGNVQEVISVVNNSGVDVIGWFSGHIHRDRMTTYLMTGGTDTTQGTPSTELGFTQVTISSDNTSIAYKNDDGTVSDTKHAIANDDKSHAIDFVTINKNARTVNLTRLGIGSDRSYTY